MVFGGESAAARFVVVLLSAATTPLVYLLARRLVSKRTGLVSRGGGRPTALIAAALHAVYPSFVAYSHYLFAETTFALCLIVALLVALATRDEREPTARRCGRGALAGLMTGLCFLIKPSGIFLMPVVPLWLCLRTRARRDGLRIAAAFVAAWLIPWGAWSATASIVEGRFVPNMANSGFALYLGNNPWIPSGIGTYSSAETQTRMTQPIEEVAATTGLCADDAARRLALAEIIGHPLRFAGRAARRVQEHWFPDNFLLQHLYRGYYPPLGPLWASLIGLVVVGCYLALVTLAARGLLVPGVVPRDLKLLWLGVVAALMMPSILVVSQPRYHMPSLVILLPFAALAITHLRLGLPRKREIAWIAGTVAFLLLLVEGVPTLIRHHTRPSGHYRAIFSPLLRAFDNELRYVDQIAFRRLDDSALGPLTFTLLDDDATFFHTGSAVAEWNTDNGRPIQGLVHSGGSPKPLRLRITAEGGEDQAVVIEPLTPEAWRGWRSTGLPGLEYRWDPTSQRVPTRAYFPSWPAR
jgi:4-amino-4-deoxy-L-arabinose transferase-like glycosyltransferase